MNLETLKIGFMPLVDAAPLVVAQEMGFAAEEGLQFDLIRAPSWSALRDQLAFGKLEAAHMLSPVPVAGAMGVSRACAGLSAVSVLSVNGNVVGVSKALAARLRDDGHRFDFNDAKGAGEALIRSSARPLRIGVPFPFSMHTELLHYWLAALGLPTAQAVDVRTVPPPLMAEAIDAGEIDAFCVGEPWGTKAVETGVGELLLPTREIWSCAPEKVLAVRDAWLDQDVTVSQKLIRAVWKANRWLGDPSSHVLASELLARPEYLDLSSEWLTRALSGRLVINARGEERHVPQFVGFFDGAATFPWESQAEWIGAQMAQRFSIDHAASRAAAAKVFRSDLHRAALAKTSADLPEKSIKQEGAERALEHPIPVSKTNTLGPNAFFDGLIFDPFVSE